MVVGIDVTQLHFVVASPCNALLDGINLLNKFLGLNLVIAQCSEQTFSVRLVGLANGQCLRIVVEVVIAITQTQSCLRDAHDVVVCVAEVGTHPPGIHHGAFATTINLSGNALVFLAILNGTNTLNIRHDRL